jgi:hypothetical protein
MSSSSPSPVKPSRSEKPPPSPPDPVNDRYVVLSAQSLFRGLGDGGAGAGAGILIRRGVLSFSSDLAIHTFLRFDNLIYRASRKLGRELFTIF